MVDLDESCLRMLNTLANQLEYQDNFVKQHNGVMCCLKLNVSIIAKAQEI